MKLNKNILRIIENNGFIISEIEKQNNGYYAQLNQYTPEGEDWWITIIFDGTDSDFIKEIVNKAQYFDIDEEVEVLIPHRGNGGCPNSITALIEDAKWKERKLSDLAVKFIDWEWEKFNAQLDRE